MYVMSLILQQIIHAAERNKYSDDTRQMEIALDAYTPEPLLNASNAQFQMSSRKPMRYDELVAEFFSFFIYETCPQETLEAFKRGICDANSVDDLFKIYNIMHVQLGEKKCLSGFCLIKFIITNYIEDQLKLKCIKEVYRKILATSDAINIDEIAKEQKLMAKFKTRLIYEYNHNDLNCSSDLNVMLIRLLYKAICIANFWDGKNYRLDLQSAQTGVYEILRMFAANKTEYESIYKIIKISTDLLKKLNEIETNLPVEEVNSNTGILSKESNGSGWMSWLQNIFTRTRNVQSDKEEIKCLNMTQNDLISNV